MSEQKDLQTQVQNEEELLVTKLHSEVLLLLGIDKLALSRQNFLLHLSLLQAILVTRGIDASSLTYEQIFLLTFYHMGCQLRKQGVVREFEFERIKKRSLTSLKLIIILVVVEAKRAVGIVVGQIRTFAHNLMHF